jgi:hypothetical protein
MKVEDDPCERSALCLQDCKSYVLQVTDTDVDDDMFVGLYHKILDSINQAISYRPRSVELHIESCCFGDPGIHRSTRSGWEQIGG